MMPLHLRYKLVGFPWGALILQVGIILVHINRKLGVENWWSETCCPPQNQTEMLSRARLPPTYRKPIILTVAPEKTFRCYRAEYILSRHLRSRLCRNSCSLTHPKQFSQRYIIFVVKFNTFIDAIIIEPVAAGILPTFFATGGIVSF